MGARYTQTFESASLTILQDVRHTGKLIGNAGGRRRCLHVLSLCACVVHVHHSACMCGSSGIIAAMQQAGARKGKLGGGGHPMAPTPMHSLFVPCSTVRSTMQGRATAGPTLRGREGGAGRVGSMKVRCAFSWSWSAGKRDQSPKKLEHKAVGSGRMQRAAPLGRPRHWTFSSDPEPTTMPPMSWCRQAPVHGSYRHIPWPSRMCGHGLSRKLPNTSFKFGVLAAAAVIAAVTLAPASAATLTDASASGSSASSGSSSSGDSDNYYSSTGGGASGQWPHPTISQPDWYSDEQGMEFYGFYDHGTFRGPPPPAVCQCARQPPRGVAALLGLARECLIPIPTPMLFLGGLFETRGRGGEEGG